MLLRVEVGQNTYTVALRVTEGNEKETQCLSYNCATLLLGGRKYRNLVLQVGSWTQG
jgi:hypothetical protein